VSHIGGLIAGNVLENPLDFGFDVMTTTTHKSLRGPRGGLILCKEELAKKIDKAVFPGLQGGPLMNAVFAKLICFLEADTLTFHEYAEQVIKNAQTLYHELDSYGFRSVYGKTENHLLLLDMTPQGVTGDEAEKVLDSVSLTVNKNMIPDDKRKPLDPSGIRLGTPGVTTRGMKEAEMKRIAEYINRAIQNRENEGELHKLRGEILEFAQKFPVPGVTDV
jgi:glycine hydroxymethyltransferase